MQISKAFGLYAFIYILYKVWLKTVHHKYLEDWPLLEIPLELNSIKPLQGNPFLMRYLCSGQWLI